MLLAIDAGNTNIVFAVYDGEVRKGLWRASNDQHRTADEYAVWLMQLMGLEGVDSEAVDAGIVATVVPASLFNLRHLCQRYFGVSPLVIGDPDIDLGMTIRVDNPSEVGADRIVNAVAAHSAYSGPLIIIDFGTATTFDIVDAAGNYCGGVIAPGVNLSLEALHQAAAKLPLIAVGRPERVIGCNTVTAMQSGIFWGYVSMIEGLAGRIEREAGEPMTVVATGGLAALFAGATDVIDHIDSDLTLRGLLEVHRRNGNVP
ncbi:MAG: type III pantothenate kinase [Alphaproteobacteria bacterium]|nr:type III pantothenate kinase [Alphaproteobacteria bacterium]